jgi:hypothetical protein
MARLNNLMGTKSLGMILLGIWLILTGLLPLVGVRESGNLGLLLNALAVAAGLLILIGR